MSARVKAHVVQTRKELAKQGQGIITNLKLVLGSVKVYNAETEWKLRQEMNQRQQNFNSYLNSISVEFSSRFQEWESQFQCVKQAKELEIE